MSVSSGSHHQATASNVTWTWTWDVDDPHAPSTAFTVSKRDAMRLALHIVWQTILAAIHRDMVTIEVTAK